MKQRTLDDATFPDADEVMTLARQRTHAEGHMLWTPRHYEILREEWLRAYPHADAESIAALRHRTDRECSHESQTPKTDQWEPTGRSV